jgi:hypothetical protein
MSTGTVIVVVVAVLVVLVLVAIAAKVFMQRKRLRDRFGPEYDRTVAERDNRLAAEKELSAREKKHTEFELKPLSSTAADSYSRHWAALQEQFVNSPEDAVKGADRLVTDLMAERGYPTEGYEAQLSVLSVEHGKTLEHYRKAHDITESQELGEADTEDLRNAMVHYRTLFEDLLHTGARREKTDV